MYDFYRHIRWYWIRSGSINKNWNNKGSWFNTLKSSSKETILTSVSCKCILRLFKTMVFFCHCSNAFYLILISYKLLIRFYIFTYGNKIKVCCYLNFWRRYKIMMYFFNVYFIPFVLLFYGVLFIFNAI